MINFSLILEYTSCSGLPVYRTPEILLCLYNTEITGITFYMEFEDGTQMPMFAWQALCQLSQLSISKVCLVTVIFAEESLFCFRQVLTM